MDGEYRDEKGRWLPGVPNGGPRGGGRPREGEAERIRAVLRSVLDDETLIAWAKAMKRKVSRGSLSATEFLFDRVLGKPAVNIHHEADGALNAFVLAWRNVSGDLAGELADGAQPGALAAGDQIDGDEHTDT
jgi:hypothetical protein